MDVELVVIILQAPFTTIVADLMSGKWEYALLLGRVESRESNRLDLLRRDTSFRPEDAHQGTSPLERRLAESGRIVVGKRMELEKLET